MDDAERQHREDLLEERTRHPKKLERQAAEFWDDTPLSVSERRRRQAREHAQQASRYFKEEHFKASFHALTSSLKKDPDNREAQRLLRQFIEQPRAPLEDRLAAARWSANVLADPRFTHGSLEPYWCFPPFPEAVYRIGTQPNPFSTDDERFRAQNITLKAFQIARYPVMVWQYRLFWSARGYDEQAWWSPQGRDWLRGYARRHSSLEHGRITQPNEWDKQNQDITQNQPVVGISYYEAAAFCRWLTQQGHDLDWLNPDQEIRLPSEAEWEAAATWEAKTKKIRRWQRTGGEKRQNVLETDFGDLKSDDGYIVPVGLFWEGRSPGGALDMAGNIWEWTASYYDHYPHNAWQRQDNPSSNDTYRLSASPSRPGELALRGGAYDVENDRAGWSARDSGAPHVQYHNVGFRVVVSSAIWHTRQHIPDAISAPPLTAYPTHGGTMTTPDEETLDRLRRRLHYLEVQQATYGLDTRPHITIEIEDIRKEIAHLTEQMQNALHAVPPSTQHAADSDPTALRIPEVFISYSRKNSDAITELAQQLRARGLRVWRDIDNLLPGHLTEQEIRAAIDTVAAAIIYVTPESLASDYIMEIELPAILARYQRERTFPIIQIFDRVEPAEVDKITRAAGVKLSNFSGVKLPPDMEATLRIEIIAQVARSILESVVATYLKTIPANQPITVDLFSMANPGHRVPAPLSLDWVTFFHHQLPSQEQWRSVLLPALRDAQEILVKYGVHYATLRPASAHLSPGYAFGYVFRAVTDIHLCVQQVLDRRTQQTQEWCTDHHVAPSDVLAVESPEIVGPVEGDTTLELSISRPVNDHVRYWLTYTKETIYQRIKVHLPTGPGKSMVQDGTHALAIALQIEHIVHSICKPGKTIHLFGALPVGLAVLIGTRLNRCGRIQCYEQVEDIYQPSCLLK